MKKILCLTGVLAIAGFSAIAQDEGAVVKKERIERSKSIFISGGPSYTLGKNIGDYSKGINVEMGYLKRVNRVLSIGPSISYAQFKYDPAITTINGGGAYVSNGDPNSWGITYNLPGLTYDYGYIINLTGGDLSLTSLTCTFKLNFIPVKDDTKFSIYGFAKPFITMASHKDVFGTYERYTYETYVDNSFNLHYETADQTWYPDGVAGTSGPSDNEALKSGTDITGGILIGPGIEFIPAGPVSFYLQAAFGYTFPVTFVSTKSYDNTVESLSSEKYPMIKKGFPSVNIQFGLSFNF